MQRGWIFTRHYDSVHRNFAWKRESEVEETGGNSKNSLVPVLPRSSNSQQRRGFVAFLFEYSYPSNRELTFINYFVVRRQTCRKFPLLEQRFIYFIGIILLKPYFMEVVSIYGAVNNYRLKHIFRIVSSIFPRNYPRRIMPKHVK